MPVFNGSIIFKDHPNQYYQHIYQHFTVEFLDRGKNLLYPSQFTYVQSFKWSANNGIVCIT